jgi:hypothetical protein
MKEKILKLRSEGKSYNQIKDILGCSKGTISFHCGEGQKQKSNNRTKKFRNKNKLVGKIDVFKRKLYFSSRDFSRIRSKGRYTKIFISEQIKVKDVINKFGKIAKCYLTGKEFNLLEDSGYSLDHIIPYSNYGASDINNMGILDSKINIMKGYLSVQEFIYLCTKVADYNKNKA